MVYHGSYWIRQPRMRCALVSSRGPSTGTGVVGLSRGQTRPAWFLMHPWGSSTVGLAWSWGTTEDCVVSHGSNWVRQPCMRVRGPATGTGVSLMGTTEAGVGSSTVELAWSWGTTEACGSLMGTTEAGVVSRGSREAGNGRKDEHAREADLAARAH